MKPTLSPRASALRRAHDSLPLAAAAASPRALTACGPRAPRPRISPAARGAPQAPAGATGRPFLRLLVRVRADAARTGRACHSLHAPPPPAARQRRGDSAARHAAAAARLTGSNRASLARPTSPPGLPRPCSAMPRVGLTSAAARASAARSARSPASSRSASGRRAPAPARSSAASSARVGRQPVRPRQSGERSMTGVGRGRRRDRRQQRRAQLAARRSSAIASASASTMARTPHLPAQPASATSASATGSSVDASRLPPRLTCADPPCRPMTGHPVAFGSASAAGSSGPGASNFYPAGPGARRTSSSTLSRQRQRDRDQRHLSTGCRSAASFAKWRDATPRRLRLQRQGDSRYATNRRVLGEARRVDRAASSPAAWPSSARSSGRSSGSSRTTKSFDPTTSARSSSCCRRASRAAGCATRSRCGIRAS